MNDSMKISTINSSLVIGTMGLFLQSSAATTAVDWLELAAGGTASSFSLLDDTAAPLAGGRLLIQQGISFPGFPSPRTFAGGFWAADTGFSDSDLADLTVQGLALRVAPIGGAANYTIEVSLPEDREVILVVGDLYHGATAQTVGMTLSAISDGSPSPVVLAGMFDWSNGVSSMSEDLVWNESAGTLVTSTQANGESTAAFFRIAPISGANPRLVLSVPQGFATGTGDTIVVGLGVVVPEPAAAMMLAVSSGMWAGRRRRRGADA